MRKARTWNGRSSQADCNVCVTHWRISKEWLCRRLNRGESGQSCPVNLEWPLAHRARRSVLGKTRAARTGDRLASSYHTERGTPRQTGERIPCLRMLPQFITPFGLSGSKPASPSTLRQAQDRPTSGRPQGERSNCCREIGTPQKSIIERRDRQLPARWPVRPESNRLHNFP